MVGAVYFSTLSQYHDNNYINSTTTNTTGWRNGHDTATGDGDGASYLVRDMKTPVPLPNNYESMIVWVILHRQY